MSLLPVDEAQRRLLARAAPLPAETVPLGEAASRWLAEPLRAKRDQPWTDLSAMDGYAVRWADMPGPWTIAGTTQAGDTPPDQQLGTGYCQRIFTGAPLPSGADTVVLQEDVSVENGRVTLTGEGPSGQGRHVRPRASDFGGEQTLLAAGMKLGAPQLALAALAGHGALPVHARPRIVLLSTGSELVAPGAPCPPGKLPASNGLMIGAMARRAGAAVIGDRLIADDLSLMTEAFRAAGASGADVIVTSGGASVGDHDLVRPALEAAGGAIDFWRVAMRPGKPLIVGRLGSAIVLGLPGNPVSALVTGALFLLPLLRQLGGARDPLPRPARARLGAALPAVGARADYLRAVLDDGTATPVASQDSAAMRAAARANALIVRPAGAPPAAAGETIDLLDWTALGLD